MWNRATKPGLRLVLPASSNSSGTATDSGGSGSGPARAFRSRMGMVHAAQCCRSVAPATPD